MSCIVSTHVFCQVHKYNPLKCLVSPCTCVAHFLCLFNSCIPSFLLVHILVKCLNIKCMCQFNWSIWLKATMFIRVPQSHLVSLPSWVMLHATTLHLYMCISKVHLYTLLMYEAPHVVPLVWVNQSYYYYLGVMYTHAFPLKNILSHFQTV